MPDAVSRIFIVMACCLVLGACGQRGPLHLPQASTAATSSATSPGATATDASGDADEKKPAPSTTPQP